MLRAGFMDIWALLVPRGLRGAAGRGPRGVGRPRAHGGAHAQASADADGGPRLWSPGAGVAPNHDLAGPALDWASAPAARL